MPDIVHELLATQRALDKLGARGISDEEAAQLPRNPHVTVRNPRGAEPERRRLLIGRTDGGRVLTLVIADRRPDYLADRDWLGRHSRGA